MATADLLSMDSKRNADRQKALDSALAQIERQFGKGSIMKLGADNPVMEIEATSTGSLGLDIALGIGGLPKGRIIEIYGPESSGKTTLTLHVGAGTFLPVKADDTTEHRMHSEWGSIDAETATRLNNVRAAGGRLIAVGTTSLRLVESAADAQGVVHPFKGDTDIFITPGYRFKAISGLMTNFHLPKSTLFMLVSALMGRETMQAAYAHAIANEYRFYSYGDSSLLLP